MSSSKDLACTTLEYINTAYARPSLGELKTTSVLKNIIKEKLKKSFQDNSIKDRLDLQCHLYNDLKQKNIWHKLGLKAICLLPEGFEDVLHRELEACKPTLLRTPWEHIKNNVPSYFSSFREALKDEEWVSAILELLSAHRRLVDQYHDFIAWPLVLLLTLSVGISALLTTIASGFLKIPLQFVKRCIWLVLWAASFGRYDNGYDVLRFVIYPFAEIPVNATPIKKFFHYVFDTIRCVISIPLLVVISAPNVIYSVLQSLFLLPSLAAEFLFVAIAYLLNTPIALLKWIEDTIRPNDTYAFALAIFSGFVSFVLFGHIGPTILAALSGYIGGLVMQFPSPPFLKNEKINGIVFSLVVASGTILLGLAGLGVLHPLAWKPVTAFFLSITIGAGSALFFGDFIQHCLRDLNFTDNEEERAERSRRSPVPEKAKQEAPWEAFNEDKAKSEHAALSQELLKAYEDNTGYLATTTTTTTISELPPAVPDDDGLGLPWNSIN